MFEKLALSEDSKHNLLLAALMVFFAGFATGCAYLHFDKLADMFATASAGNLVGALVMRMRGAADPAVLKMLNNNGNGGLNQTPLASK